MQQPNSEGQWAQSPMVDGNPTTAKIMVIAMSPGEEELDQGIPLVGATGHMLWTWLGKHGISRVQCYCVNTIGEMPTGSGGKSITPAQYDHYWQAFDDYTSLFTGQVVIILGGDALWRYTGLSGGIESWRGYVVRPTDCPVNIERRMAEVGVYKTGPKKGQPKVTYRKTQARTPASKRGDLIILPTLHPAGVMRTGNTTLPVLVADLERAVRASREPHRFLQHIVNASVAEVYNSGETPWNPPSGYQDQALVFDIEGYDHVTHLGTKRETSWPYSQKFTTSVFETVQPMFANPEILKVGHNLAFDVAKLRREGLEINGKYFDTMLAAAMVEPDIPKGLKYVAPMYLDLYRWDHKSEEDMGLYNAHDVLITDRLYGILQQKLRMRGQLKLFKEVIMPCLDTLMELSAVGLYISEPRRQQWLRELSDKYANALADWSTHYPGIDVGSPHKLKAWFKSMGMEIKYNKYGGETLDENAIRTLMVEAPEHKDMLEKVLTIRGLRKDISTYASISVTQDNTIHPSYLPAGKDDDRYDEDGHKAGKGLAGTWRPTSKGPNVQNVTREGRCIYVPRTPGHVFAEFDFESFEARILSQLSGDSQLMDAIAGDIHKRNSELLGVDRTRAKNGFYGWSYGVGPRTLRNTFRTKGYDITEKACRELLDGFNRLYPKAAAYRNRVIATARESRMVRNPFGLCRYFYAKDIGTAPANTIIQSTAAIIMWKILPALAREAKRQHGSMVVMVHDSVAFELPAGFDPKPFKDIMEQEWNEIGPGFKVPVTCKVGPSWGEVKAI